MALKFNELDATQKRLVFWLADEAGTLTPFITGAAYHPGELWEAKAFLADHPKSTPEHEQLVTRLRLGDTSSEGILDAIKRIAPAYVTLEQRTDAELDELLSWSEIASTAL